MELDGLDESELAAAARDLGACLQVGDVVLLVGPMGAGKTTFTRALAQGLGVLRPERVRSPTYNLCLVHPGPRPLAHVDLFRFSPEAHDGPVPVGAAFEALGLEALVDGGSSPDSVVVIEWGDLWADPPRDHLRVELRLEPLEITRRKLVASAHGARAEAVVHAWRAALEGRSPGTPIASIE